MDLTQELEETYTKDSLTAVEAQLEAKKIVWGPVVFQVARVMVKSGIADILLQSPDGTTETEAAAQTGMTVYAVRCLLEASLTAGLVIADTDTDRFSLSKTGWFVLRDAATRIDMDFVHDVLYEGFFHLEESLRSGKPEGLRHFGGWPTVYEGLSSLPDNARDSWFRFDHYYSDTSFDRALDIVLEEGHTGYLYDIGGNTGKWALKCVSRNPEVRVKVIDLPQQIAMMHQNIEGKPGCERISSYSMDILDSGSMFPPDEGIDAIWMSQFLDCFSESEVVDILTRAAMVMESGRTRLYVMETLWDRQQYPAAAFALTMTSLYFTAIANGNSKMFRSDHLLRLFSDAGLEVERTYDRIGLGHSIIVCRKKSI